MKSDIFDTKRFISYITYEIKGGVRTTLLTFLAIIGILAVITYFSVNDFYYTQWSHYDPMHDFMSMILMFGLYANGVLAASMMWSNLSKKELRLSALTLPASHIEKYLARWLFFIPLATICYLLAFEIVDTLRVIYVHVKYPSATVKPFDTFGTLTSEYCGYLWGSLILAQAIFALGSSIWPSKSVIKTILALMGIFIVIGLYGGLLEDWLLEPGLIYGWHFGPKFSVTCIFCTECIFAMVLYIISYYRIKEIELIQRW